MKLSHSCITGLMILSPTLGFAGSEHVHTQFTALDSDADGVITRDEIKNQPSVIRDMHLYYEGGFLLADVNKDGVLDHAEFSAFEEVLPVE